MTEDEYAVIQELETKAEELRKLLSKRAAKRPLIVEFSGSPKAGKTMAISVLSLFLKRNGIKVEAFAERASVSPIKGKGRFDFNAWVSCASLQGMLESLDKEIDIFVLDRGLFDALIWNTWLKLTGKINSQEADDFERFFTMERWIQLIDLVCVLKCDPLNSIEREYLDQLTTRRGTIMDESILKQLNEAADITMHQHRSKFKRILQIDTTSVDRRDGVARITTEILQTLHRFLDETICVIPKSSWAVELPNAGFVANAALLESFSSIASREKLFFPKSYAENNTDYLIPIPCAIVRYEDQILFLKRNEEGHSLHDTYTIWAGGHIAQSDDVGPDILVSALRRELSEELFIRDDYEIVPLGIVRTSEDERASRHIGIVYQANLSSPNVALALHQKEFRETRGRSMSGRLVDISKLNEFRGDMGDWSRFIVDHYWPMQGKLFS